MPAIDGKAKKGAAMRLYQVDAFTDEPFRGNPAGVCLLEAPEADEWMQLLAREMNLSETAFLHPAGDGFHLRWFTPTVEVDLCGHATLAAAHILWETGRTPSGSTIRFDTRSGMLGACRDGRWTVLDFPSTPAEACEPPPGLAAALGVVPSFTGRSRFDYLVEVSGESDVRGLRPDISALGRLPVRGVMVTAPSDRPGVDFVSRFFAPAVGVDEDPVTGSAHCCLGPHWSRRTGKTRLTAYQASARGGIVTVEVSGDRVRLGGQAVTVMEIALRV
jgi:predicted PhzF superfamily epimerase YddE/YHI9